MPNNDNFDFDELMRQVDAVINDQPIDIPQDDSEPEIPSFMQEDDVPARNYANHYGITGGTMPAAQPGSTAYNPDFRQRPARPAAIIHREEKPMTITSPPAYEPSVEKKRRKRRFHPFLLLGFLLLIAIGLGALWLLTNMEKPQISAPALRKPGAVTVLLCGTDYEGTRTDTMMLLYLDSTRGEMNLVSLPRDTLTYTSSGRYAKLNSAYGRNNGAQDHTEGMEALVEYVAEIIGYAPDAYMLVDLDFFVEAVDTMGGIDFDVPQDMYYDDPSQDLHIDLKAGMQHLSGYDAMGLVRFRKGYATQDIGRVEVQRDFIAACAKQWLSPKGLLHLPWLLTALPEKCTTNLSVGNMLWLGWNAMNCRENVGSGTLPGYADMVEGASVYVLYPYDTADLINELCNPFYRTIDRSDLKIAQ